MQVLQSKLIDAPAAWFAGDVYPTILINGQKPSHARLGLVRFAPGARTAWHSHAVGQYLHVTDGYALIQERGEAVKIIRTGETVFTAAGVEHWHGAPSDNFMAHLALWEASDTTDEPETVWKEHLSAQEYSVACAAAQAVQ